METKTDPTPIGNFVPTRVYSADEISAGFKKLREPFLEEEIQVLKKKKKDGTKIGDFDYVGHAAVRNRLLLVDPYWTWKPVSRDQYGNPALTKEGNGLWIVLTILGISKPGFGDAGNNGGTGNGIKEAIGDAIRNAAMNFGVALDLWAKIPLDRGDDWDEVTPKNQKDDSDQRSEKEQARDKPKAEVIKIDASAVNASDVEENEDFLRNIDEVFAEMEWDVEAAELLIRGMCQKKKIKVITDLDILGRRQFIAMLQQDKFAEQKESFNKQASDKRKSEKGKTNSRRK